MNHFVFKSYTEAIIFITNRNAGDKLFTHSFFSSLIKSCSIIKEEKNNQELLQPGTAAPALSSKLKYVIRDSELQIFESLVDAIKSTASVGFFYVAGVSEPAKWAALIAIFATIYKVGRQALTKGIKLDARHFRVVFVLNKLGRVKIDELLHNLNEQEDAHWSIETVDSILKDLKETPSLDGTVIPLVANDRHGFWWTSGI